MIVKDEDKPPSIGTRKNIPDVMIDVDIKNNEWDCFSGTLIPLFKEIAASALQHVMENPIAVNISLVLADDPFIQMLNRTYRNKDAATNVLSFPQIEDFSIIKNIDKRVEIGDIVISLDTVQKESREQKKSIIEHSVHMFLHGFLHLLGFDHMSDAEATEMENLESHILSLQNIPDPYRE